MAKGKHSVALFEVIQAGKSSSRANSLRTPKWWFKSKKTDPAPPAPVAVPEVEDSSAPAPRTPGVDLKLDPDRQRIKFEVSYTSAIVAAFTVIVVVGLSYVIGSHMTRGPAAALANTDELLKGPAQPGVLKVGSNAPIIPPMDSNPKTDRTETISTPAKPTPPPGPAPVVAQPAPQPNQRVIGLNYTVVQSFPAGAKAMAFDVCNYLNANGVPCTVETNLGDYPNLFVVVGLEGFQRVNDAAYKKYDSNLRQLSTKLGNDKTVKNARFMRFDNPAARLWRGTEKTATP